jgi:hypothetical protein
MIGKTPKKKVQWMNLFILGALDFLQAVNASKVAGVESSQIHSHRKD